MHSQHCWVSEGNSFGQLDFLFFRSHSKVNTLLLLAQLQQGARHRVCWGGVRGALGGTIANLVDSPSRLLDGDNDFWGAMRRKRRLTRG